MGYRTVNHVPSIYTYAQAKQIHDNIVPIRGRDIKPLGQRRDGDTYHIRMNGEDVECVLYKTPVVTFHPDDTITVSTDNWNTVSTHQFIWAITGCNCYGSRGKTVIRIGDKEYVINEIMRIKHVEDSSPKWEVLTKEEQYDWAIDRQKANAVRLKYKKFISYLRNGLKLRLTEESAIFSVDELVSAFGTTKHPYNDSITVINGAKFESLETKEPSLNEFFGLILDESEESTTAYYKAMLMLVGRSYIHSYRQHIAVSNGTGSIMISPRSLIDKLYECMYKWHSDEVFVRVKLAEGKVPTGKYDSWV